VCARRQEGCRIPLVERRKKMGVGECQVYGAGPVCAGKGEACVDTRGIEEGKS